MAISPATRYPGQVDTGIAGYPHGRARNVNTPGAADGTPLEKDLVNDLFGFEQAMLVAAERTPSGTPETSTASQYLAALKKLTKRAAVCASASGTADQGDAFDLAVDFLSTALTAAENDGISPDPHFVAGNDANGDYIEATKVGLYLVSLNGIILGASASDGLELELAAVASAIPCRAGNVRYGTNPLKPVYVSGTRLMQLGGIGQRLYVANAQAGGSQMTILEAKLSVVKINGGTHTSGW